MVPISNEIEDILNIDKPVLRKMIEYNVVVYTLYSQDYLDYDIMFAGNVAELRGYIRSGSRLELKHNGYVYLKEDMIVAIEIREVPTDE